MSSVVYPLTLEAMWEGGVGAVSGDVKAVGVDTDTYTYSAAHEFLDDLSGIVSNAAAVTGKAFTGGVFTASPVALTGISGAEHLGAVVTYVDTGVAGTSRLLTFTDTRHDSTEIDLDGNGEIVAVDWPSYVGRI